MRPVHIIAAHSANKGIGFKGGLPWNLPKEMQHFHKMTKDTQDPSQRNIVVMGRNTWQSIPARYRPLKGRFNVIITRSENPDEIFKALPAKSLGRPEVLDMRLPEYLTFKSVEEAITNLRNEINYPEFETIWLIGGARIYKEALDKNLVDRLYLTQIERDYISDVHFPEFREEDYKIIEDPRVSNEVQVELGVRYKIVVYEKKDLTKDSITTKPPPGTPPSPSPSVPVTARRKSSSPLFKIAGEKINRRKSSPFGLQSDRFPTSPTTTIKPPEDDTTKSPENTVTESPEEQSNSSSDKPSTEPEITPK